MSSKKILVVEDEEDISMLIQRSLDMKTFEVTRAESGFQALEILETFRPDLILLDVMMPDLDGFEVCRRIKEQEALQEIPVVFLTVRNNEEDFERGKEAGAAGYFTKPFDPFQLGEEIAKLL